MRDVRKDYSSRYLNVGLSSICTCLHTTYTPTLVGCVQSRDEPEIAEERVCGYFIETDDNKMMKFIVQMKTIFRPRGVK